jgi:catechol 2,3-dioxygenase-like lactoylglutathione lyase family enzyme
MLGVNDLDRSKKFYVGLGATIEQDYPGFVNLNLGEGSSSLATSGRSQRPLDWARTGDRLLCRALENEAERADNTTESSGR